LFRDFQLKITHQEEEKRPCGATHPRITSLAETMA